MSSLLSHIAGFAAARSPGPKAVNGDQESSRGVKRKAKVDPYDDLDEDDSVQKTPTSQHPRSRPSPGGAPGSSASSRTSAGRIKRRGRPSGGAQISESSRADESSRVDAPANLARAKEPQAARLDSEPEPENARNSLAPVADMGESGIVSNGKANNDNAATNNTVKAEPEDADNTPAKASTKGKGKQMENAAEDPDGREEHEILSLLTHRMIEDGNGQVELLVHWVGESEDDATWENEEEIQKGADETLYAYWKAQGGRLNALFIKPKNPPPETYHLFKILGHEKKPRGGFQFEVQWVGHAAIRGETSMETESKLRNIAPDALNKYWESVGGRHKFLAKRGRGKKARTE
ncbi:hypothetical protein F5B20DRAFT_554198 [Whalleya microplaca]|nr:hypothetical protein F5B20DRAFT_554198 [Whalleya microplaca]